MTDGANTTLINICIVPPTDISEILVQQSKSLGAETTIFSLDGVTKFPHMTVYMARFPKNEIPKVLTAVRQALTKLQRFECTHSGYFITEGGYLEASYAKTQECMSLQSQIIDAVKQYRSQPGVEVEEHYYAPYTESQRKNARETGYDLAYELYRPHITLTRYQTGKIPPQMPTFAPVELSFTMQTIGVFNAEDNGAVYEKLAEYTIV